jgi:class 3 adenylate cyclase
MVMLPRTCCGQDASDRDEAEPGQILISARVLRAVKVEPVGEFDLNGIRRPLAAFNVVGVGSPAGE